MDKTIGISEPDPLLFLKFPETALAWDYENNSISPNAVSPQSNIKVSWKCKEGHSFTRAVNTFVYKTKNCPECKKQQTMVYAKPFLMKFWDIEKNKLDPKKTSAKSSESAFWKCPKCGYAWETSILSRHNGKNRDLCPCCDTGMVIVPNINDFISVYPELGLDTSQNLNPNIDLSLLGVGSHVRINWKCHKCGYPWKAPIYGRIRRDTKPYRISACPVCANNQLLNSVDIEYPELINYYSVNNNVPLNQCNVSQKKKCLWTCDKHGDYEATIRSMIRSLNNGNSGCPYCHGIMVKEEESFGVLHPELVSEWSDRNNKSIFEVAEHSGDLYFWTCEKGHLWKATPNTRAQGYGFCRKCYPVRKTSKMFAQQYPELRKYYSNDNETVFDIHSIYDYSLAAWKCDKGHIFYDSFYYINQRGFQCPYCTGRKVMPGYNDFQTLYPEYAKDYSQKNNVNASELLPNDSKSGRIWNCSKGHEYTRSVSSHIKWKGGCPICSRHVLLVGNNDILTAYPQVANIWDYDRNEKRPECYFDTTNVSFHFLCKKGHHYSSTIERMKKNGFRCLVCDNKYLSSESNSLGALNPKLASEWSPNNERTPYSVLADAALSVKWICPICGGEYLHAIRNRFVGDDACPYCNGKRLLPGFNDLATVDPELAKEWSPSNECLSNEVTNVSKKFVNWICPTCGGEYSYRICDREVGDDCCPYCSGKMVLTGFNDLATVDPELAKEWDESNTRNPDTVLPTMRIRVLWKCNKCGGKYYSPIKDHVNGIDSCPFCSGRELLPGFNDLETTDPSLASEWAPSNKQSPKSVMRTNSFYARWICHRCHGEYGANIKDRSYDDDSCPYCSEKSILPGYNDLLSTDPELAKEWSNKNTISITSVRKNYKFYAKWICPDCGGEYSARINDRKLGDNSCPYCKGIQTLPGYNDLKTTNPELVEEWSPNNTINPFEVRKTQYVKVLWICPKCSFEYSYTLHDRYYGDCKCPRCNDNILLPGINDLETIDSELAEEWSSSNELSPDQIRRSLTLNANWICPTCGGEYSYRICDREVGDDSCPYCSGKMVLTGFNDLATVDPELAKEWSPSNECLSNEVTNVSKKCVNWICPTCGGEYSHRICDREVGDDSCPYCSGKKILPGYNSIKASRSDLMAEWCEAENTLININPDNENENSTKEAWWHCNTCDYIYSMSIKKKVKRIQRGLINCPRCNGRRRLRTHYY